MRVEGNTRTCRICKVEKSIDDYYFDTHYNQHVYYCKTCHNKKSVKWQKDNKYYSTEKGKESWRRNTKKARIKHKDKWLARQKTRYFVSRGVLEKKPCEVCGDTKVQAHHPDYSNPLLVKWLCVKHHCIEENRWGIK